MFSAWSKRFGRSLGWRISAGYALGFIGGFILVGVVAIRVTKECDLRGDREEITQEFTQNAERCRQMGTAAFHDMLAKEPPEVETTLIRLSDAAGETLFLTPEFTQSAEQTQRTAARLQATRRAGWQQLLNADADGALCQVYAEQMPDGGWLQVSKSDHHWRQSRERLRGALLPVLGWVVVVALGGAVLLTLRTLRPVRQLIDTTRRVIGSGDLTARVPVRAARGNELDDLSVLFNEMLARNEDLIRGMRESLDNVAHDLRTPLTRLRNSAEKALRDPHATVPTREEALGDAIEEAESTLRTLRVLTDISEAEQGAMRLHLEAVDLRELITGAADLYEYSAEERGVRLRVEVPTGLRVRADKVRLQQVVANLLDNAIKYGRPGGEIVLIGGKDEVRGRPAWFSVADQGVGIEAHDLPRIWDRLYRADRSRSQRGSGLGLSLVKAIVQAHGGRVEVESTPDIGSVFTVILAKDLPDDTSVT